MSSRQKAPETKTKHGSSDNRHQEYLQLKKGNAYQRISNLIFPTEYLMAQKFKSQYQTTLQKHPKMWRWFIASLE